MTERQELAIQDRASAHAFETILLEFVMLSLDKNRDLAGSLLTAMETAYYGVRIPHNLGDFHQPEAQAWLKKFRSDLSDFGRRFAGLDPNLKWRVD